MDVGTKCGATGVMRRQPTDNLNLNSQNTCIKLNDMQILYMHRQKEREYQRTEKERKRNREGGGERERTVE